MFSTNTRETLYKPDRRPPMNLCHFPVSALPSAWEVDEALFRRRLLGVCNFVSPIRLMLLVSLRVEPRGLGKFAPRARLIAKVSQDGSSQVVDA